MNDGNDEPYFNVYSEGVCHASVCSNLPQAAVEARMRERSTGVSSWELSKENFKDGAPNPGVCDSRPSTHKHYLFVC